MRKPVSLVRVARPLFLSILAMACISRVDGSMPDSEADQEPTLTASTLLFSDTPVGQSSSTELFRVLNGHRRKSVVLQSVSTAPPFFIVSDPTPVTVAPGESAVIQVAFRPNAAGTFQGLLRCDLQGASDQSFVLGGTAVGPATDPSPEEPSGPLANWRFEESSGQTLADSALGNDAVLGASAEVESSDPLRVAGVVGGAIELDGVDDTARRDDGAFLASLTSFSYSAWIYPRSFGGGDYGRIVDRSTTAGFDDFYFLVVGASGALSAVAYDTNRVQRSVTTSANSVTLGVWHHVAVTHDASSTAGMRLFIDGREATYSQQDTITTPLASTSNGISIGNRLFGGRAFDGIIDELSVYARALEPTEIAAAFAEVTLPTREPPPVQPVAGAYYVSAATGDDANSCDAARDPATPKRTAAEGINCLHDGAGEVVYLRGGTYVEGLSIDGYAGDRIAHFPSGTSWANAATIASYPGEQAIIQTPPGIGSAVFVNGVSYLIFDGIVFDGYYGTSTVLWVGGTNHHIRVVNCEIENAGRAMGGYGSSAEPTNTNGMLGCGGPGGEVINSRIHDNGTGGYDHGIYGLGECLFEGNEVYRNAGWGVHKYPNGDNVVIRRNLIHDNGMSVVAGGSHAGGPGIGLYGGNGNLVYDNVIWNNAGGIALNYGEANALLYNNTIYANARGPYANGISNGESSTNPTVVNNIVVGNPGGDLVTATPWNASFNLCSGPSAGCTLVGDASFVNSAATPPDLHISASSLACNAGADLSGVVDFDFDGAARPQGSAFDLGAYEVILSRP